MVCQVCWATTQAFHDLYKQSKEVQDQFLKALVKIEADPIDLELSTNDDECSGIADSIKLEGNSGMMK